MNMITDRTSRDVERWKSLRDKGWQRMTETERKEWLGEIVPTPAASKGMYTHNDLNRVERAVETIANRFRVYGYDVSSIVVKTNWTYRDVFTREDMERYLFNVSELRGYMKVYQDTPEVPKIDKKFNYELANDIEKILVDVDGLFTNLTKSWYYSGELFAGEV